MPRNVSGVYSPTAGIPVVIDTTISDTVFNNLIDDLGDEITASLPVSGVAPMTGVLRVTAGTVGAPGLVPVGDTNTGIYAPGADQLAIATGGVNALTFSATQTTAWSGKAVGKAFDVDAITDVASASTCDIGAAATSEVNITGTTTITGFGTANAGIVRRGTFAGALTLTHNGTSLILPGAANLTTAAGDSFVARSLGSGNWRVMEYTRAAVAPLAAGGMVLLTSGTVSSVATVDLALTSGYRAYRLIVTRFVPATADQNLIARFSNDGGATYTATTVYVNTFALGGSDNSGPIGGTTSNTFCSIGVATNNTGVVGQSFVDITPGGASTYPVTFAHAIGQTSLGVVFGGTRTAFLNTSGYTATHIRLLTSSGNISTLVYALYGIA